MLSARPPATHSAVLVPRGQSGYWQDRAEEEKRLAVKGVHNRACRERGLMGGGEGEGSRLNWEHPWVLQRFLTACVSYFESLAVPFSNSYTLYFSL